jgi:hypothetical protein
MRIPQHPTLLRRMLDARLKTETEETARHRGLTQSTRLTPHIPAKPVPQPWRRKGVNFRPGAGYNTHFIHPSMMFAASASRRGGRLF